MIRTEPVSSALVSPAVLDAEIVEVVGLLRKIGFETFSSCSGRDGHLFGLPTVRLKPCDAKHLFHALIDFGYNGFYIKEYRSAHVGSGVDFVEVEFWTLDCLKRNSN